MSPAEELLGELIALDTRNPGGDEPRAARRLAEHLAGFAPDRLECVLVPRPADRPGAGAFVYAEWGHPATLINVHLDTVPANAGWSSDPLVPRRQGRRLYGLGAADTKGAIAALLAALARRRPRNLAVLFSGDEERGGSCLRAWLASGLRPASLVRAVVCEPTGLAVGTRHRGILAFDAIVRGPGGHSSAADHLQKPLVILARLALALDALAAHALERPDATFPGLCVNVAALSGGVAFNVVPAEARLVFSLRPAPGTDMADLVGAVQALTHAVDPAIELVQTVDHHPFATRDLGAFTALLGARTATPQALPFWTEACLLAEGGLDAVVFGPGDIAQAHAPDEHVALSDLEGAEDAFVGLLGAL